MAGWWAMADTLGLAGAGLLLDIIGVSLLFWTSLPRRVEADIFVRMVSELTEDAIGKEWVHPYSFEEHKRRLARSEQAVRRNAHMSLFALGLILAGFILQLLEVMLRS